MGELLTLGEVGRLLKIQAETVRRLWIKTGKLPAVKVGRQWRVDADHLQEVLARQALEQSIQEPPDAFADLNDVMAPGGECTRASEQDQAHRDNAGREFISPVNPDEAIPEGETRGREFTPPEIPE
jgi:excisionase family DNA binding protein